jgi:hypothetical protein
MVIIPFFLVRQTTERVLQFGFGLLEGGNKLIVELDLAGTAIILGLQPTRL